MILRKKHDPNSLTKPSDVGQSQCSAEEISKFEDFINSNRACASDY